MARWFQYQVKAEPVQPPVTEDMWHQPWSEPVKTKIAPLLAIALIASGLTEVVVQPPFQSGAVASPASVNVQYEHRFQYQGRVEPIPIVSENITVDKWFVSWTDPKRLRPTVPPSRELLTPLVTVPPVTATFVEAVSSDVVFSQSIIYQASTQPITTQAEIITIDKWYEPFTDPVRTKAGLAAYQQQFLAFYSNPVVPFSYYKPLVTPVRQKPGLAAHLQQYETRDRQVIPTSQLPTWFYPLSEPTRAKKLPTAEYSSRAFVALTGEVITPDKWFVSWTDPVRQKQGFATHLQQSTAFTLDDETQIIGQLESRWHYPWSEPVRVNRLPIADYPSRAFVAPVTAEVITVDKWFVAWTDPSRVKRGQTQTRELFVPLITVPAVTATFIESESSEVVFSQSIIYQAHTKPVLPLAETITVDKWFVSFTDPVRTKPGLPAAEQQFLSFYSNPIITFGYYGWLAEPVRQKPGLGSHLQQTYPSFVLDPDTKITQSFESKWHQAWSEPVRLRQFPAAEQHYLEFQQPIIEVITADKWIYPWSEPVRKKPPVVPTDEAFVSVVAGPTLVVSSAYSSQVIFQQSFIYQSKAEVFSFAAPEVITEDKWHQAWSDPVRIKAGLRPDLQQFLSVTPPFIPTPSSFLEGWSYPWSEPVRTKYLATAQQQFLAWNTIFAVEVITEDKWHQPWSLPVRVRPRLPEGEQQFIAFYSNPIITFGYYGWLSEPVRPKKGLGGQYQQSFTTDPTVIPTSKIATWLYPWSEPVRKKPGLLPGLQQVTTPPSPIYPILTRLIQWFRPLEEPVREKRGFKAWLQQFFTVDTKPIAAQVLLTINATETDRDSAFFGIVVYNKAVGCNVSIKEIPATRSAAASIEET